MEFQPQNEYKEQKSVIEKLIEEIDGLRSMDEKAETSVDSWRGGITNALLRISIYISRAQRESLINVEAMQSIDAALERIEAVLRELPDAKTSETPEDKREAVHAEVTKLKEIIL